MQLPTFKPTFLESPKKRAFALIGILLALFLIASVGFGWSYWRYTQTTKRASSLIDNPVTKREEARKEIDSLLGRLSQHILLPADEEPIVATITDARSLAREQPFYRNAQDGDKVFIYVKEKKAIIYNPTIDKIINVGPVYGEARPND